MGIKIKDEEEKKDCKEIKNFLEKKINDKTVYSRYFSALKKMLYGPNIDKKKLDFESEFKQTPENMGPKEFVLYVFLLSEMKKIKI